METVIDLRGTDGLNVTFRIILETVGDDLHHVLDVDYFYKVEGDPVILLEEKLLII